MASNWEHFNCKNNVSKTVTFHHRTINTVWRIPCKCLSHLIPENKEFNVGTELHIGSRYEHVEAISFPSQPHAQGADKLLQHRWPCTALPCRVIWCRLKPTFTRNKRQIEKLLKNYFSYHQTDECISKGTQHADFVQFLPGRGQSKFKKEYVCFTY